MSDYQDSNGEWRHGTSGEKIAPPGSGGGSDPMGGAIGQILAGAAGPVVIILILLPAIMNLIFELVYKALFKLKIAGRIIQSVFMGSVIGFILVQLLANILKVNSPFMLTVLAIVSFGLPAFWYYSSHYFTLKALMVGEPVKTKGIDGFFDRLKETMSRLVFLIPLCILSYGLIVAAVIAYFLPSEIAQFIVIMIPFVAAGILYAKKCKTAKEDAQQLKAKEGSPLIGMVVALALSLVLPLLFVGGMVKGGKDREKAEKQAAAFAVEITRLSGQSLTVDAPTLNMYADAVGGSNVIKTLKQGEKINATGNVSGLFVPVQAGSDKGFVFAPSVKLNNTPLVDKSAFPFLASVNEETALSDFMKRELKTLYRGEVTVLGTGTGSSRDSKEPYVLVEYENTEYRIYDEQRELLKYVKALPKD